MSEKQRIEYGQLEAGFEFPANSYKLDSAMVSNYLKAVEDTSRLYQDTNLVPPMAIAACAMAALSENISLPPGTIHVSQEFEFRGAVTVNDTLTSFAKVSRKQSRGEFHLLTTDFNIVDQNQKVVLTGKTSFILPALGEAR
jgi:acyl dehydratase